MTPPLRVPVELLVIVLRLTPDPMLIEFRPPWISPLFCRICSPRPLHWTPKLDPRIAAPAMLVSVPPPVICTPGPLFAWIWPKLTMVFPDWFAFTPGPLGDWMKPRFSTRLSATILIVPTVLPVSCAPGFTLTVTLREMGEAVTATGSGLGEVVVHVTVASVLGAWLSQPARAAVGTIAAAAITSHEPLVSRPALRQVRRGRSNAFTSLSLGARPAAYHSWKP